MTDTAAAIIIGATAGITEVSVNQPLIYFKNCLQTKTPIQMNPLVLYRGYGVNIATLAPITAFQVAATSLAYSTFFGANRDPTHTPELSHMIISSSIAGGLSGAVGGPSESIILQQQKTGLGALETFRSMYHKHGLRSIFRGTPQAMIRDAGFSSGFLAVGPYLSDKFSQSPHFNNFTAPLFGGLAAGIFAAILTHPFDTLKTRYQNDYQATKYSNFMQVVRAGNVYQGVSARGTRVITGTIIISNVTRVMNKEYQKYKPVVAKD